ncbi:hypothetical protein, partial [Paenibacillus chibensis]|uniref:hypothetical protein n=1 Tax=Paenibacillus chibensis TaxID=59846 RepID=UPI001C3FE069
DSLRVGFASKALSHSLFSFQRSNSFSFPPKRFIGDNFYSISSSAFLCKLFLNLFLSFSLASETHYRVFLAGIRIYHA